MAKLLWHVTASLDGFITGPAEDMTWIADHVGPNPAAADALAGIRALLIGGRTYRFAGDPDGKPYGGAWSGPMVVVTGADPAGAAEGFEFVADLSEAVARVRRLAGEEGYVAVFGANLARSCAEAGLLDEVLVHVAPRLLGDGVRMFESPGGTDLRLEPLRTEIAGSVVNHWLRVVRD